MLQQSVYQMMMMTEDRRWMSIPTLSQTWTVDEPRSAMCVQSVDVHVSCSSHSRRAVSCVLHRPPSQVIHCIVWYSKKRFFRERISRRDDNNNKRPVTHPCTGEREHKVQTEAKGERALFKSSQDTARPRPPPETSAGTSTVPQPERRRRGASGADRPPTHTRRVRTRSKSFSQPEKEGCFF